MANNKKRYTDKLLTEMLSDEGYKYINIERGKDRNYVNSICPNGNKYRFYIGNWNKGKRCKCSLCLTDRNKNCYDDVRLSNMCNDIDITFLKRQNKKMFVSCNKTGLEYSMDIGNFVKNPKCRCEECGNHTVWTEGRIKQEVEPDGYEFVSYNYDEKGNKKPRINFLCPSKNPYTVSIHRFIGGQRCHCEDCTGNIKWTDQRIKDELSNHDLLYISHYRNKLSEVIVTYKCDNETISESSLHNLMARDWKCTCENCSGRVVCTKERIVQELEKFNYTYINHYRDEKGKLIVDCLCDKGHRYSCRFHHFLYENVRCGQCNMKSHGETQIYNDFTSFGIKFIHEDIFEGCVYKDYLPFDFVVYDKDCNVICCIEYDWKQHYEPVRFGNQTQEDAEECFKNQQLRDKIKTDYCKNNNIPLVRVSYEIPLKEVYEYIKTTLLSEFNINIEDYHNAVMSPAKLITFESKVKYKNRSKYSEDELKQNFVNLINKLGHIPSYMEFKRNTSISLPTYNNRFNFKGKVYDNVVKMYVSESEFIEYYKAKQNHKSEIGKITGSLSRKHSDEEIETEFRKTFDKYISENGKCPSKRTFNALSRFDDSFYRKRMGRISWTDVCKKYGYDISSNLTSKQKSA